MSSLGIQSWLTIFYLQLLSSRSPQREHLRAQQKKLLQQLLRSTAVSEFTLPLIHIDKLYIDAILPSLFILCLPYPKKYYYLSCLQVK